jgi:hypothetical protein
MADNVRGRHMTRHAWMVIVVGLIMLLIVACYFIGPVLSNHMWKGVMEDTVYRWCLLNSSKSDKSGSACKRWAADMMTQHHDAIMACAREDGFGAMYTCVGSLGLKP